MNFPTNLKYTNDHEWILIDGNKGTIGITEYAQSELGDVVFVDIDPALKALAKGERFGTIEAVKTVSELYAPCDGTVVEINADLSATPENVNSDPYGNGWMVKIEISDLSQLNDLLNSEAYAELTGK